MFRLESYYSDNFKAALRKVTPKVKRVESLMFLICEDCGDEIPKGQRRHRCKNCGKLVCGWCYGHVHNTVAMPTAGGA